MIHYEIDEENRKKIFEIIDKLEMKHIKKSQISCIRSFGSKSKRIIARCHSMSKAIQTGFNLKPLYVVELITENFDKLGDEEKVKTLIHELMHIPISFGGGFKHHNYVTEERVERLYRKLISNNE